jgi:hypothetical protein
MLNNLVKSRFVYYIKLEKDGPEKIAVIIHKHIFTNEITVLVLNEFSHNHDKITIIEPKLIAKKIDNNIQTIKLNQIKRPVFFSGKAAYIDEKVFQFLTKETLFSQVSIFEKFLDEHYQEFADDEIALITINQYNLDVINFVSYLMNKLRKKPNPIKKLEVFIHGIYSVFLTGGIGSEKLGLVDVVIWKQYINKDDPEKSTYYAYPISHKKPTEDLIHQFCFLMVNQKPVYVDVSNGRRISHLRISHPFYNSTTKQLTYVLDKLSVQKLSEKIIQYYAKNN